MPPLAPISPRMTTGLRNLARTLWRFDRSRVTRTTVLVIGSALLEGMGVVLLIPLLQLIGIGTEGAPGRASRLIGSSFAAVGLPVTLSAVLAAFVGILLMQAAVQRAQAVESQRLTTSFALYLRETLYSAITRARWDFLAHRRTSDLTQLLTEEADRAAHAAIELIHLGMAAAVSLVYLTVAFRVSPAMSGIALFSGSLLWFLLRRRTQNSRIVGAHFSRSSGMMYRAISEHLSGLKTARSYGAEKISRTSA